MSSCLFCSSCLYVTEPSGKASVRAQTFFRLLQTTVSVTEDGKHPEFYIVECKQETQKEKKEKESDFLADNGRADHSSRPQLKMA